MAQAATDPAVVIEEYTPEQGLQMLEQAAQERFGCSWGDFDAAYLAGKFRDTDRAHAAEELAFLSRFAG